MKSRQATLDEPSAPIVVLADDLSATPLPTVAEPATPAQASSNALERARAFAEPLLRGRVLDTGEDAFDHAEGVAAVLKSIGGAPALQAAAYLV